jgi:hypothetical protein
MTVRIYGPTGNLERSSRNLRGLLDHARRTLPQSARLEPHPHCAGYYLLTVRFETGETCSSKWADWRVCADWLQARRSWPALQVQGLQEWAERYRAKVRA